MRRRLFNLAAAVSLVLCVAVVLLWFRSYSVGLELSWSKRAFYAPTAKDIQYARQEGYGAVSVVNGIGKSASFSRGIFTYAQFQQHDVISVWDELFWRKEARNPHWVWVQFAPDRPAVSAATSMWSRSGFAYHAQRDGTPTGNPRVWVSVPIWVFVIASAILPVSRLITYCCHRSRLRRGACPRCGYDLRATPDRCPECGTVPRPPHNPPTMKPIPRQG
jgi:hypothetical protein